MTTPGCPVCHARGARHFRHVEGRDYWRCDTCLATFLAPDQRLARAAEHRHYLNHENDPQDPRYRRFLSRLAEPLLARLAPGSQVLDYGCGPGPALAAMLEEAGHRCALYDPFFFPDPQVLQRRYDAVTCTETAEHFHDPAGEFAGLAALLRPGGWLAVMTRFQNDDAAFADWHYRRDPTHVVFYRAETLAFIAARHGLDCEIPCKDVALLRRPVCG